MVDRTDIDALLIGALYGELTPADEARLTAHLESHPADRTALDRLTRTRAAVRDSRILAFQLEPPHAISALLLQEASRRAPRAATARGDGETASWFQRFVRSFMAHPAMAAAAMLVLVVTAAGTFYLRGTDEFARSEPPAAVPERAAAVEPPPPPPTGVATPAPQVVPIPEPEAAHAGAPRDPGPVAAGSAAVGADLDQEVGDKAGGATRQAVANDPYARPPAAKAKASAAPDASRDLAKLRANLDAPARPAAPARVEKADRVRGIELRTPQLAPKDLQDNDEKPALARGEVYDDGRAAGPTTRNQRAPGAPSGGGAPPMSPPASVAAQPAAPPPSAVQGPGAVQGFEPDQAAEAPAKDAKRAAPRPVPTTKPMPPSAANSASNAQGDRRAGKGANTANTANADAKQAEDKSTRDPALLEWARKQRDQVIALVSSNRCRDAASAAVQIYNRAPDYFNANVATDRQIRPCLAYVNDQRERADRSRAANKSAADVQASPQAAPTRK